MTLVNAETGEVVSLCTPEEAADLTHRIRNAAEQVWSLLLEAHERRAWVALGYGRWEDYVRAEFDMSRQHAYRLLDQATVIREIEAAAGVSPVGDISEREARDIKPHLPEVTDSIRERTNGVTPEQAADIARKALDEVREQAMRQRRDREEQRELEREFQPPGFNAEADGELVRQRGALRNRCRELAGLGDPVEFIGRHIGDLRDSHIEAVEEAYGWLDTFLLEWRESQ